MTGLVLSNDRVGIGSQKYRVLRMEIFALTKLAEDEASTRVSGIQGWLSHLRDVDQNRYLKLAKLVKALREKNPSSESLNSLEIVSRQKLMR